MSIEDGSESCVVTVNKFGELKGRIENQIRVAEVMFKIIEDNRVDTTERAQNGRMRKRWNGADRSQKCEMVRWS